MIGGLWETRTLDRRIKSCLLYTSVTAILDIALHAGTNPVCLADISERQNISLSYLEQLFAKLRRGGLVKSVRGPGGGYRLALPADQISIGMVI